MKRRVEGGRSEKSGCKVSAAGIWAVAVRCGVLLPVSGNGSGGLLHNSTLSLSTGWSGRQLRRMRGERSETRRQWPHIWPPTCFAKVDRVKSISTHMMPFSSCWVGQFKNQRAKKEENEKKMRKQSFMESSL